MTRCLRTRTSHDRLFKKVVILVWTLAATGLAAAAQASAHGIRPGDQWFDQRGQMIQAHGGSILQIGQTYYWFGEDHSRNINPNIRFVSCYSSTDLIHWSFRNHVVALTDPEHLGPRWILERPRVFYNSGTKKYVMYVHLDDSKYKFARVAVLTSDTVTGSYKYLQSFRPLDQESRDIGQFVDDDGSAYLIFESRPTGGFFIARLSDDYLRVEKQITFINEPLEGGAIAHVAGLYYVLGSHLTGYDANPNVYATASTLAGPWSKVKNIAPPETNTYDSQSTMLLKIVGSKSTSVIYIGDRWNAGALWDSRYVWMPLRVEGNNLSLPKPQNWTIDIRTGLTSTSP